MEPTTQTEDGGATYQPEVRGDGILDNIAQHEFQGIVADQREVYVDDLYGGNAGAGAIIAASMLEGGEEASSAMDAIYTGITIDPTGKTIEEQLAEYNEQFRVAGFPDQSHLHHKLPHLEEQAKRSAWERLQHEDSGRNLAGDSWSNLSTDPTRYLTAEGSHSGLSAESAEYHTTRSSHSDLSTGLTDYYTAVSSQEQDSPYDTSPSDPSLALQIYETQREGTIYIHDQGVNAAQSRGRLVLLVGAAANASPQSDSSVSTVDGFPDTSI